jgi:hypothetical protein
MNYFLRKKKKMPKVGKGESMQRGGYGTNLLKTNKSPIQEPDLIPPLISSFSKESNSLAASFALSI